MCCSYTMKLWSVVVGAVLSALLGITLKKRATLLMMRFFRNMSRFKARKRLHGNEAALIPLLLGREEPLSLKSVGDEGYINLTIEQLSEMRGQTEDTPIYLSVKNRIYDVSYNRKYYGPGKPYHIFTGRDATYAYATGCSKEECLNPPSTRLKNANNGSDSSIDYTAEELVEIDRWLELYDQHDKYRLVGLLVEDPVERFVATELECGNGGADSCAATEVATSASDVEAVVDGAEVRNQSVERQETEATAAL